MNKDIITMKPEYGVNYGPGYMGAVFGGGAFSYGIGYLTRDHKISDITVSHVFTVEDEYSCIEALVMEGVTRSPLSKYFAGDMTVFFRKPDCYTEAMGISIAAAATTQLGKKYDKGLIAAQALRGTLMGRVINSHCDGKPDELISRYLNEDDKWICAELHAFAMATQPELRGRGILGNPAWTIDPQELFECDEIFSAWHFND